MAANYPPAGPQPVMHTQEATPAIADPAPLGLAGFGLTTMMLSFINAGIIASAIAPRFIHIAFNLDPLLA